jgi:hypothetical protein
MHDIKWKTALIVRSKFPPRIMGKSEVILKNTFLLKSPTKQRTKILRSKFPPRIKGKSEVILKNTFLLKSPTKQHTKI